MFAPVAQSSERSPPKAEVAGEIPAGSTSCRASGSEGIADPTDRESVSLGGASPLSPTIFRECKPQQTGTGLLIRYGEVATTSGSTSLRLLHSVWRRLPRQSAKRVGGLLITCSASAWQATFLPGRLIAGHRPLKASVVVRVHPRQPLLRSPLAQNESGSLTN